VNLTFLTLERFRNLPPSIKTLVERKDDKGQDTFDISDWFSIQLSIPIRSRLTLTTYSYRCSLSLTIDHSSSSSRVSRGQGEREEWVRGFSRLLSSASSIVMFMREP
jgi:hypothetical protein